MQKCFLLCIDENENVFKGMMLAVKSLERTNPKIPVAVFYYKLNEEQISLLKNCLLIKVDHTIFNTSHRPDLGRVCCIRLYVNKSLVDNLLPCVQQFECTENIKVKKNKIFCSF